MDITGKVISRSSYTNNIFELEIKEAKGIYFIKLQSDSNKSSIIKILKE